MTTERDFWIALVQDAMAEMRRRYAGRIYDGGVVVSYRRLADVARELAAPAEECDCAVVGDCEICAPQGEDAGDDDFDRNACPGCGGSCQAACR